MTTTVTLPVEFEELLASYARNRNLEITSPEMQEVAENLNELINSEARDRHVPVVLIALSGFITDIYHNAHPMKTDFVPLQSLQSYRDREQEESEYEEQALKKAALWLATNWKPTQWDWLKFWKTHPSTPAKAESLLSLLREEYY